MIFRCAVTLRAVLTGKGLELSPTAAVILEIGRGIAVVKLDPNFPLETLRTAELPSLRPTIWALKLTGAKNGQLRPPSLQTSATTAEQTRCCEVEDSAVEHHSMGPA